MTIKREKKIKSVFPPSVSYEDGLRDSLREPGVAAEYLNAAFEEGEPELVLAALKDVMRAHGDIQGVANEANITRQAIYAMLSEKGNPTLKNFSAILKPIGLKITFSANTSGSLRSKSYG